MYLRYRNRITTIKYDLFVICPKHYRNRITILWIVAKWHNFKFPRYLKYVSHCYTQYTQSGDLSNAQLIYGQKIDFLMRNLNSDKRMICQVGIPNSEKNAVDPVHLSNRVIC